MLKCLLGKRLISYFVVTSAMIKRRKVSSQWYFNNRLWSYCWFSRFVCCPQEILFNIISYSLIPLQKLVRDALYSLNRSHHSDKGECIINSKLYNLILNIGCVKIKTLYGRNSNCLGETLASENLQIVDEQLTIILV